MAKKRRKGSKYSAKVADREPVPDAKAPAPRATTHVRPPDPSDTPDTEIRFVQASRATKSYLCPGCNQMITPGTGHLVAVPPDAPDLRRHWHRGCWLHRHNRG